MTPPSQPSPPCESKIIVSVLEACVYAGECKPRAKYAVFGGKSGKFVGQIIVRETQDEKELELGIMRDL